jgi:hypothetical protein
MVKHEEGEFVEPSDQRSTEGGNPGGNHTQSSHASHGSAIQDLIRSTLKNQENILAGSWQASVPQQERMGHIFNLSVAAHSN